VGDIVASQLFKMRQLKILNSKEIKEILKLIEAQWGAKLKLDYAFLKNPKNQISQ